MGVEEELAARVRTGLSGAGTIREVKMFGGIGFMLNGNMVVAVSKRGLLARVGKDRYAEALKRKGARPMAMGGRTMEGYLFVDPETLTSGALKAWLEFSAMFVRSLPPKVSAAKPARKTGKTK